MGKDAFCPPILRISVVGEIASSGGSKGVLHHLINWRENSGGNRLLNSNIIYTFVEKR